MPKDEGSDTGLALPKTSVKRIMKLSDEVGNVSADSIVGKYILLNNIIYNKYNCCYLLLLWLFINV